jgi:ssDNA-binding Zn-finger/Zn-ribbon topoisomerase 1
MPTHSSSIKSLCEVSKSDPFAEAIPLSITFRIECPKCNKSVANPKNRDRFGLYLWDIENSEADAQILNVVHTCPACGHPFTVKRGTIVGPAC